MSSCSCYKSKFQFDESLIVEHLLVYIHSHNSGIVVASKLEEISQKLVLGWVQFWAVPEVVFSYGEFFQQRNTIKEVINKQNKTKYFSRFHSHLITAPIEQITSGDYGWILCYFLFLLGIEPQTSRRFQNVIRQILCQNIVQIC
ncbi:Hypothetical_protein [Hexamita inflata]|uniref:Hypothetical_protein n=1 Tax=Hexamita inflata TaxID=28002 RepID=A0AA86NPZ3_9EUKA|nr:Hypothetical protein HINF_LOCUS11074 [Hexamita inflata]